MILVAGVFASACESDVRSDAGSDAALPAIASTPTGAPTTPASPPSTAPGTTTTTQASGQHGLVVVDPASLPPMEVVASLGYPRDLLDRGRVNVKISRDDDTKFVVFDKRLIADHFGPAPIEERRTVLPTNGRVVALQTLFGDVTDCDSPESVAAILVVTFTYGHDPIRKTMSLPFTDSSTLDEIRLRTCTVRQVLADNEIELRNPVVDGETMSVDLVVRRRAGNDRLGFDAIKGTVLFGAETPFESGSRERVMEPDENDAVIPLVIDVNRCDAHAVAETTRKFGLDLYTSVDGAEAQLVAVPVDAIVDDLESMLEHCKRRTGQ